MVTASTPAYRFLRGQSEYVRLPTAASTAYNVGDLIWNNAGVAAVASTSTFTNTVASQAAFRKKFVGVCCDNKLVSDASTNPILICTKGVFAYPCAALSGAAHVGEYVAPDKDSGSNLLDQTLAITAGYTASIGTLNEEAASGATSVVVRLQGFATDTANSTNV